MISFKPAPDIADLENRLDAANLAVVCADRIDSWAHSQREKAKAEKRVADIQAQLDALKPTTAQAPVFRLHDGQLVVQRLKGGRWQPVEDPDAVMVRLCEAAELLGRAVDEPLASMSDWTGKSPINLQLVNYRPDLTARAAEVLEELGL